LRGVLRAALRERADPVKSRRHRQIRAEIGSLGLRCSLYVGAVAGACAAGHPVHYAGMSGIGDLDRAVDSRSKRDDSQQQRHAKQSDSQGQLDDRIARLAPRPRRTGRRQRKQA